LIRGAVSADGVPTIEVLVAGQAFAATIDTGFNGDLELPSSLREVLNPQYLGRSMSVLAAGQTIEEDVYRVQFPFDSRRVSAQVTFVPDSEVLIGTHFLRDYRLEVNFQTRIVLLERLAGKFTQRTK
jgi:predicted aspartyl protease